MNSKDKAKKLIDKYYYQIIKGDVDCVWQTEHLIKYFTYTAKECAIKSVDETLLLLTMIHKPEYVSFITNKVYEVECPENETYLNG